VTPGTRSTVSGDPLTPRRGLARIPGPNRTAATDQVCIRVVWRGGQTTTAELRVPVGSFARLSNMKEIEETIARLAGEGQSDEQIAAVLAANGHRAPSGIAMSAKTVQKLRLSARVFRYPHKSRPRRKAGYLTLSQIADKLQVAYENLPPHLRR